MKTIRCSALPLAFECVGSQAPCENPLAPPPEIVACGNAVHRCLEWVVRGETPCVRETAMPHLLCIPDEKREAALEEVNELVAKGAEWYERYRGPAARSEVEVEREIIPGVKLTGHIDFVVYTYAMSTIADFKSGFKEHSYSHQVLGYAFGLDLETDVRLVILPLREHEPVEFIATPGVIAAWVKQKLIPLAERIAAGRWEFNPGDHCIICKRRGECQAKRDSDRNAIVAFQDFDGAMTTEHVAEIEPYYQAAKKAVEEFGKIRRSKAAEGPIPLGNGFQLEMRETRGAEVIDPWGAWPVLKEAFKDDYRKMLSCMSIKKTALVKAVRALAGKNKMGAAEEAFLAEVRGAGASSFKKVRKVLKVKVPE